MMTEMGSRCPPRADYRGSKHCHWMMWLWPGGTSDSYHCTGSWISSYVVTDRPYAADLKRWASCTISWALPMRPRRSWNACSMVLHTQPGTRARLPEGVPDHPTALLTSLAWLLPCSNVTGALLSVRCDRVQSGQRAHSCTVWPRAAASSAVTTTAHAASCLDTKARLPVCSMLCGAWQLGAPLVLRSRPP